MDRRAEPPRRDLAVAAFLDIVAARDRRPDLRVDNADLRSVGVPIAIVGVPIAIVGVPIAIVGVPIAIVGLRVARRHVVDGRVAFIDHADGADPHCVDGLDLAGIDFVGPAARRRDLLDARGFAPCCVVELGGAEPVVVGYRGAG